MAEWDGQLKIGDMVFPCAVLSDGTRILTETQFMKTMGIYRSGRSVRETPNWRCTVALVSGLQEPQAICRTTSRRRARTGRFRTKSGNISSSGIPADIIPKICEVWMDAHVAGVLGPTQERIALKAEVLLRGLARVGIIAMVDEATGFQADRARDAWRRFLRNS